MHVRIYQPPKSTMQSGRAGLALWVLEYELETPRRPEPLMGWISAGDTLNQVRLNFPSSADAVAFATRKGWTCTVEEAQTRIIRPRSYADNFKPTQPPEEAAAS